MTIIVIDDERTFNFGDVAIYCRNSDQGLTALKRFRNGVRCVNELWLDHDLGGDDTIIRVVDWLCEAAFNGEPPMIDTIFVHSQNPVGADAVVRTLKRYGYNVVRTALPQ